MPIRGFLIRGTSHCFFLTLVSRLRAATVCTLFFSPLRSLHVLLRKWFFPFCCARRRSRSLRFVTDAIRCDAVGKMAR
ncbi:hypothetical protein BGZ61DRAFT_437146 [Ilyonectria robusta]|uniref:uncharacterized protein n=1 Tax=Ilyonectria robusta TaxID=1079257 RepID=UPI001E8DFE07|nr:uncharacterized protein BGZ61DRAFT_437146 [Ilyonectria robusta]KAH8736845.1 hypothetical protein BGZ61DRAFT_437146 [Ilyonectria robusta]